MWGEGTCWCHGEHAHARGQPLESVPSSHLSRVSGVKLQGPGLHGKPLYLLSHLTAGPPLFLFILFDLWGQAVVEFAV